MEQNSSKERKPATEQFRFIVCFVAISCVLSCAVALFISLYSLASMQTRLASVESKLDAISENFKQSPSEIEVKESLIARNKRNANPTTSLSDMAKRLIALEDR